MWPVSGISRWSFGTCWFKWTTNGWIVTELRFAFTVYNHICRLSSQYFSFTRFFLRCTSYTARRQQGNRSHSLDGFGHYAADLLRLRFKDLARSYENPLRFLVRQSERLCVSPPSPFCKYFSSGPFPSHMLPYPQSLPGRCRVIHLWSFYLQHPRLLFLHLPLTPCNSLATFAATTVHHMCCCRSRILGVRCFQ